ncbi:MAG: ParB/RepB/Spo0J family partition protein [Endomicrobiales bacterium]|nr:ParB/RepB/Spo0J family partition protein [Endomicrobiales bacterium]
MINLKNYQAEWVEVSKIDCDNKQFQFRKNMMVDHLAQSFREEGQKFPILLWKRNNSTLQVISGFRRLEAAKKFNWDKILGITIPEADLSENEALRLNFIENIERKSLTDMDLIFACKKLSDEGKSNVEISKYIGKDEAMVRRYLKVANAPQEIQDAVKEGKISIKKLNMILGRDRARTGSEYKQTVNNELQTSTTPEEQLRKALLSKDYMPNIQKMVNNMQGIVAEISGIPGFGKQILKSMEDEEKSSTNANPELDDTDVESFSMSEIVANERMFIKPVQGGGFDLVVKYRPKRDNIKKLVEFLEKNVIKLKEIIREKRKELGQETDWW